MNSKPLSQARDADLRNALGALIRAGHRARLLAQQTQTQIVVVRDGKIITEIPGETKK
ncbi:hypothetical protein AAKU67_000621 [Oxalobacteraceae bacterium GrIS 2.11]